MAKSELKSGRINMIRRAGVSAAQRAKNPNAVGNLLINGEWFSSIEFRNNLLGAGLPTTIALPTFQGAAISYKVIEITEEMLAAGGGSHTETINGREIKYTKPGKYNIELSIDFSTVNVTDSALNLNKLVQLFGAPRRQNQQAAASTASSGGANGLPSELQTPKPGETVEEIIDTVDEIPEVNEKTAETADTGHVNIHQA